MDLQNNQKSKKNIIESISIPLSEDSMKKIVEQANTHINEIENILSNKSPILELKDKEKILDVLNKSHENGSLKKLIEILDKNDKLLSLYNDMGTLINQSDAGSVISGVIALFTLGGSIISEAKESRVYEMKKILEESNISPDILNKLDIK